MTSKRTSAKALRTLLALALTAAMAASRAPSVLAGPVEASVEAVPGTALLAPMLQSQPLLRQDVMERAKGLDTAGAENLLSNIQAPVGAEGIPSLDQLRARRADEAIAMLLAHPELMDQDAKTVNQLLDFTNVKAIKKAAADLRARAAAEPDSAVAKSLTALKARFDLKTAGSVDELRRRLDLAIDNARGSGASPFAVAAREGAGAAPLAKASAGAAAAPYHAAAVPAPSAAMTEAELAAYLTDKTSESNVGLKTVRFPAGAYRDEYEPMLKKMGVDVLLIMEPNEKELDAYKEDRGFFLKTESYRWISPAMPADDFLNHVARDARSKMMRELGKSEQLDINMGHLTLQKFDDWYPLYVQEIGGRPGGQLYVKPDLAKKEQEKEGNLDKWWAVQYRDKSDGRLVGGINLKEWPDRKMLWGHYAAYAHETKPYNMSVRSFMESLHLAHWLGYPVMSMGLDMNLRGFYRSIGLLVNKSRLRATPFPEEEIQLMKILDPHKFSLEKNAQGKNEGLLFFELPRGGVIEQRYRQALRDTGKPAQAQDLLGGDYFGKGIVEAGVAMVMRHFHTDDVTIAPPTGFQDSVIRQHLDTLKDR